MVRMLKKSVAVALAACSIGFAPQASALVAADSDPNYLGLIVDGIPPSNFLNFVNNLLFYQPGDTPPEGTLFSGERYFRSVNNCPGPGGAVCAAATDGVKTDTGNVLTPTFGIDVTGYEYLWGKYDAAKAGAYVWYVGNLTGVQQIPSNLGSCGASGCGLSNFALMNAGGGPPPAQIPEPASLALMGLSLAGLALTRRRRQQ